MAHTEYPKLITDHTGKRRKVHSSEEELTALGKLPDKAAPAAPAQPEAPKAKAPKAKAK